MVSWMILMIIDIVLLGDEGLEFVMKYILIFINLKDVIN